jgi:hypothetical protein
MAVNVADANTLKLATIPVAAPELANVAISKVAGADDISPQPSVLLLGIRTGRRRDSPFTLDHSCRRDNYGSFRRGSAGGFISCSAAAAAGNTCVPSPGERHDAEWRPGGLHLFS